MHYERQQTKISWFFSSDSSLKITDLFIILLIPLARGFHICFFILGVEYSSLVKLTHLQIIYY